MWLRIHLALLLWLAGCAEQALVVSDADWQIVPPARRATIDRQHEAELAAARADLASAEASLAALQRAPAATRAAVRPQGAADERDQARAGALGRVQAAEAEVQRGDLARREIRVEAARAKIAMLEGQRELVRAQAVNRALLGDETYDSAPIRGQFSRAQRRWYALDGRARAARAALERASRELVAAKEAYAQLMRNGEPPPLVLATGGGAHTTRFELTSWRVSRGDIARRRGLGHLRDQVWTPQLRVAVTRLSPAGRPAAPRAKPPSAAVEAPGVTPKPLDGARSAAAQPARATQAAAPRASVRPEPARTAPAARPERTAVAAEAEDGARPARAPAGTAAARASAAPARPLTAEPARAAAVPATPVGVTTTAKPVERPVSD